MEQLEIERKWLMEDYPPLPALCEEEMEQGYLSFSPAVRIRKSVKGAKTTHCLTIKGKGTLCRTEVELALSAQQYMALCGLLALPPVCKRLRRYALPGGLELECSWVDEGQPGAFFYAEVEFESLADAQAFIPPPFLGREVTEEPGYTMAAYCRRKAGLLEAGEGQG